MSFRWLTIGLLVLSYFYSSGSLGAVSTEVVADDPEQFVSAFQLETWTVEDGLPQNSVLSVTQDSLGYLWVGTVFGLARFDGAAFTVFDRDQSAVIPDDVVTSLHASASGRLYWGTQGGLVMNQAEGLVRLGRAEGLPFDHVLAIAPEGKGGLWVLTHPDGGSVSLLRDGRVEAYEVEFEGGGAVSLLDDRQGSVWIAESRGVSRLDLASRKQEVHRLSDEAPAAFSVVADSEGRVWVGSEGGVYRRTETGWHFVPLVGALAGDIVHHLSVDRNGGLWASGSRGVARLLLGAWSNYPLPRRHTINRCSRVIHGAGGDYWFGSRDNGLHRIRHASVEVLSSKEGLANESIWSLCEGAQGELWIGTGGGLSRWTGDRVENFGFAEGVPRPWVTTVCQRRNGELWFGMRTGGQPAFGDAPFVGRMLENDVKLFSDEILKEISRVWVIFEDRREVVWVGTLQELFRYEAGTFQRFSLGEGALLRDVRVIAEDDRGGLWFGTNGGGLCYWSDGVKRVVDTDRGLSHNNAWAIHIDDEGVVWVGTESGLNRIEGDRIDHFGQAQGLFDDLVNQVLEDAHGNLWLSCNRGVYRVRKSDLNALAAGKRERIDYVVYGTADGMLSAETNGECQPAGCRGGDGQILFPTSRGVVIFDPSEILSDSHAPPVLVESMWSNQRLVFSNGLKDRSTPDSDQELEPGSGSFIEFKYTANSFVSPGKVRFQYRLRGHHDDWVDAGPRRTAHYLNLAPGDYRFQVKAADHQGVWNEDGTEFAFSIQPHLYERPIFQLSIVGIVSLLLWAGHRRDVLHRVKMAHLEDQVKLVDERSRIARDMHDEIGATLTQISMLSELADREQGDKSTQTLSKIKKQSRELVQSVDEIVWATNPRNDSLEGFIAYFGQYATEFLKPTGLDFRVEVPPPSEGTGARFDSEVRHHLFLAAKEALNNAVKHAHATSIRVNCRVLGSARLVVSIEDDGDGIASSVLEAGTVGNGLRNMSDRMAAIGGICAVDGVRTGGLKVTFEVPYP